MSITTINAGQAVIRIVGNNDDLKKALDNSNGWLQKFTAYATQLGARLQAAGQMMLAPFQQAAEVFQTFERQMLRVSAVTSASVRETERLIAQAQKLGATTSFTAAQVAEGMAGLGMMGFSTEEISQATPVIMDLSKATGTDLGTAAQIAANQLRVFGMRAQDTRQAADLLAATANGSAQTLTDLGEAPHRDCRSPRRWMTICAMAGFHIFSHADSASWSATTLWRTSFTMSFANGGSLSMSGAFTQQAATAIHGRCLKSISWPTRGIAATISSPPARFQMTRGANRRCAHC
jgi:hypothetical protein